MSKKLFSKIAWATVGLLIAVLFIFAIKRIFDTFSGATHENLFELRYLEHPIITTLHMISGIMFILFAPLQFSKKIRSRKLGLHRALGRVLVICALISGIYGLVSTVALPAFGGLGTETAAWFFGSLFLFSILRAFWCARHSRIIEHREWMIRSFALGLAVGTQRVILFFLLVTSEYSFQDSFGPALWMAFAINLLIAEMWIAKTRRVK